MAFALVGSAGAVSVGAVNTAVTPAYGQTPTAGNLLLCFQSVMGATSNGAVPSGWNSVAAIGGTTGTACRILWRNAVGGDAAPTIAAIVGGAIAAHLEEWSGGATGAASDQQKTGSGTSTTFPITMNAADAAAGELVAMVSADVRSVARATNDTWTSNNGTPTLRASNNGVSSTNHYSHATMVTTSNATADTVTLTASITTSVTQISLGAASFLLAPAPPPGPFNRSSRLTQHLAQ